MHTYLMSLYHFYLANAVRIMLLIVVGLPVLSYISSFVKTLCLRRFSQHSAQLVQSCIFYGGTIFIGVNILHEFGFNITALLGAAGVIGIAIGFAAQTSISNIISGFFLLLERPFSIGDTIKTGDVLGVAESIDLLAIRIRTLDNKLIRIPNETVLKQSLTNITYYPTKRLDLMMSCAYTHDINPIKAVIMRTLELQTLCLKHPTPVIKIDKIAQPDFSSETRIYFAVRVWVSKDRIFSAGSQLIECLKKECDIHGISITINQVN